MKISKVKNFEGYWFTCNKCGRRIKHAFTCEGKNGVFGSECIYEIAGIKSVSQVKRLMAREKSIAHMRKCPEVYDIAGYADGYKCSVEDIYAGYLEHGNLSPPKK